MNEPVASFLRKVLIKSKSRDGWGWDGVLHQKILLPLSFFAQRPTCNFWGCWLTVCLLICCWILPVPFSFLWPYLSTYIPTLSFIFHWFLLSPSSSCTHIFLAPSWFFLLLSLMFSEKSLLYCLWCMWRAVPKMMCHKEEEGNKICICRAYVQPQKWIVTGGSRQFSFLKVVTYPKPGWWSESAG